MGGDCDPIRRNNSYCEATENRAYKFIKEQLGSYWSVAMIFFL